MDIGTISTVSYHLSDIEFDGPLDLLYSMIKQSKVDIRNIFLTDITEQFIAYIQSMTNRNYDYISEFVALAAELVHIKSKALIAEDSDEYDPEEDIFYQEEMLYLRLETKAAFEQLKIAAESLKDKEVLHRFYAQPKFSEDDYNTIFKDFDIEKLISTFTKLLERAEVRKRIKESEPKTIVKERFTISEKIREIAGVLVQKKKISFFSLFEEDNSRLEVLNIFLAILELMKRQIAKAHQEKDFGDISLVLNEELEVEKLELEGTENVAEYN